jgi:peptidoglycan/LPS O-acetylase OafA/YrhL
MLHTLPLQCFAGCGGPVQWLLELPVFIPLSKLSFAAYLSHPAVLNWYFRATVEPLRWSAVSYAVQYMGAVLGTFAASVGLYLAIGE